MGRQAGSQQAWKNLWMLRPEEHALCMTHSGEMSLPEEEGLRPERRWLVFSINLTKLHSFSGYLSPKVGIAGFCFVFFKYAIGFQRRSLS